MMRWTGWAAALLLSGGGAWHLAAQERSLELERFHADIEVQADGDIEVLESISIRFRGRWNGIFRTIPVEYRRANGLQYRLFLEVEGVTGESGEELWYKESRDGVSRKLQIRVPGAEDATRTVNIRYNIPNALRFFDEHDELYWNVTGTEWPFAIRSASALVTLPDAARGRRANAFVGHYEASDRGVVEEIEEGFYFEAGRSLSMREGLTIAVAWEPGVVARPGFLSRLLLFLRSNWLFALPFASLAAMYRIWRARGRDPALRPIVPRYEPPDGLSPAEAGTLVDNRPDLRDVTAAVVDLAVRGYLRIEEEQRDRLLGSEIDYRFVMMRDPASWRELHSHEKALLSALFTDGNRDSVRMSDLEDEFYQDLSGIKDGIFARLLELGLYDRRPDHVLATWLVIGFVVLIVGIFGAVALSNALFLSTGWSILAAALTAAPVLGFAIVMPARTLRGSKKLEEVLGFQEFLDRVESDRYRRMIDSPELFERYLPYAMALGVDRKWAQAFEDIYREPPQWYVGTYPHGFRTTAFVAGMSDWSARVGSAMVSQPRSAGGSGFGGGAGGGGFSGGGFGGGGGGGW
jgi:uncharacterized membrane protein